MANSLTTNPWVIDTAGAAILFNGDVYVKHFEFAGYSAQFSAVSVQDRFGKVIWSATGAQDLTEVRSGDVGWVHGIAVPTLENSGILRIYFK
jgi:hypothetical protein